ncbi:MAG TPA: hypothetical protein P5522_10330, partial [Spirochaetia bacterium]|nr:hypothetical protein [Spirochaetia bacterium]
PMKKFIYALLLAFICSFSSYAAPPAPDKPISDESAIQQNQPDVISVMSVPFGKSRAEVKEILYQTQPTCKSAAPNEHSSPDAIQYRDIQFAGRYGCSASFEFVYDQFCLAIIQIPVTNIARDYEKMKSDLSAKYGEPSEDVEHYSPPYEKGDGYLELALSKEKADIHAWWHLPSSRIRLSMSENRIVLSYMDDERTKEYFKVLAKRRQGQL